MMDRLEASCLARELGPLSCRREHNTRRKPANSEANSIHRFAAFLSPLLAGTVLSHEPSQLASAPTASNKLVCCTSKAYKIGTRIIKGIQATYLLRSEHHLRATTSLATFPEPP